MITQCSIAHLYKAGAEGQQAVNFARSLERRKCNHWQTKDTDAECIAGVIGTETNRLNYIVATQSTKLRADMRKVPGVPLLFEKRSIILMEPPSEASMGKRKEASLILFLVKKHTDSSADRARETARAEIRTTSCKVQETDGR